MKKENLQTLIKKGVHVPEINPILVKSKRYVVRSNDSSEDITLKTAGKFDTFLNLDMNEVEDKKKIVLNSASDCFVQEMICPDFSFVAVYRSEHDFVFTINNGLCSAITAGLVDGISYSSSFSTYGSQEKSLNCDMELVNDTNPKYNDCMFFKILEYCKHIQKISLMNLINIEVSSKDNIFYLLQVRECNIK